MSPNKKLLAFGAYFLLIMTQIDIQLSWNFKYVTQIMLIPPVINYAHNSNSCHKVNGCG